MSEDKIEVKREGKSVYQWLTKSHARIKIHNKLVFSRVLQDRLPPS